MQIPANVNSVRLCLTSVLGLSPGSTDGLPDGKHSACGQQSQVAQAAPGLQSVITGSSTAVSAPRLVAMQQHEVRPCIR